MKRRSYFVLGVAFASACAATVEPRGASTSLEGEVCDEAYSEATEHSCVHAEFGPFASVTAAATPEAALSNINQPHTAYTVVLQPVDGLFQGAVRFRPIELIEHVLYIDPSVPVSVFDSTGALIPPQVERAVDPALCDLLSSFTQYVLDPVETYRVFFGPTTQPSVLAIMEHLETAACESCEPLTLVASRTYQPRAFEDAELELAEHVVFELPSEIPVVEGESGLRRSVLAFREEDTGDLVRCSYRGVSEGTHYAFEACSNGAVAGDDIETDYLRLRVRGGNRHGFERTTVELVLELECGGHDHEGEES